MAFSMQYGMEIMREIGIHPTVIRAGNGQYVPEPDFQDTLAEFPGPPLNSMTQMGPLAQPMVPESASGTFGSFREAFENLRQDGG